MKLRFSILCILSVGSNSLFAQTDSSYYSKLEAQVVNTYLEISKVSNENYFQILNKVAEHVFDDRNPNYSEAIYETAKSTNSDEVKALEIIFGKVFTTLRKTYLWNSASEVSTADKSILNIYFESLCPCITSKVTNNSPIENVLEAQKSCIANLIVDTAFLTNLRNIAGQNTIDDLFRLQRYLVLLMYEKCEIITHRFNRIIFDNTVIEKYTQTIFDRRRSDGLNVLRFYEKKQLDSLKKLFPDFSHYTNILKEGVKYKNIKKNTIDTYYRRPVQNKMGIRSIVDIHDDKLLGAQLTFAYSEHALDAKINSVSIKKFEASKQKRLVEIKEDVVIPNEKKN